MTTTQQYDALNRLTQNIQGSKRIDYIYNALGQVTNKKRYSDIQGTMLVAETNHTYDSVNRLTNITHSKGANTIASYTQSYDAGSKITGINSTDGNSTFNYDDTDQLVGADYNYQTDENYTYDANGNRTNTGYVTGINNRLLEDSKYRYEYDKVGNRTKRTDKSTNEFTEYTWDIRDRLTGIRVTNAFGEVIRTANYVYDVYDQRIAKIVDPDGDGVQTATTERFVYGSNQNIALVFDESGNLTNRHMFANGIDQIEADEQVTTGTTLWALTDHLGSVRDVVDNSGAVQNHIVYDAFGNVTSQSNSSVVFRYGYTARELDTESGLQYNRARYVDTFTGRFISEDKIGFAAGDTNLFRYVGNNSINLVDPKGLYGQVISQVRVINYEVEGMFGLTLPNGFFLKIPHVASDIRQLNPHILFGRKIRINTDITTAVIFYSDKKVGEIFYSSQVPNGFIQGNDARGHIVGAQLGGSRSYNNLFAQNARINNSDFKSYEYQVTNYLDKNFKLKNTPDVCEVPQPKDFLTYIVSLEYGNSLRPTFVVPTAIFSDGKVFSDRFSNP